MPWPGVSQCMQQISSLGTLHCLALLAGTYSMLGIAAPHTVSRAPPVTSNPCSARRFLLSPEGSFFREFLLDEIVKTVDAATRTQLRSVMLAMSRVPLPPFGLPGANRWGGVVDMVLHNLLSSWGWAGCWEPSGYLTQWHSPSHRHLTATLQQTTPPCQHDVQI